MFRIDQMCILNDMKFLHNVIHSKTDCPALLTNLNILTVGKITRRTHTFYTTNNDSATPSNRLMNCANTYSSDIDIFAPNNIFYNDIDRTFRKELCKRF